MNINVKIFFIFVFAIIILAFSNNNVLAANGVLSWSWGPTGHECWGIHESVNFNVTSDSLDSNGDFWANISGSSVWGSTYMYLDWTGAYSPSGNECIRYGVYPVGTQIFYTNDVDRVHNAELYNFGKLSLGQHTITCWGFAGLNNNSAAGSCGFGPDPSCTLSASPLTVAIGDSVTLSWNTVAGLTASINPGNIQATPVESGSISATPLASGVNTYTMTVNGAASSKNCTAQVTVTPPSCNLSADPDGVFSGEKTQLSWTTAGGDPSKIASIAPGIGNVPVKSGVASTGPITSDTTFTLTFTGLDNIIYTCSKKVEIIKPPVGGLVPCGRLANEPPLPGQPDLIDESKPCDLCSMFYMFKKTINFAIQISFALAVLMLILSGLSLAFSAGDTKAIEKAKGAIRYTLIGLAIISAAWLIISFILQGMGYAGITTWNQVDCILQK